MLRMVLLGLLIPLGVGVLSAMELRSPRSEGAVEQPAAETTATIVESYGALPKGDRLEVAAAISEAPLQPALGSERITSSEDVSVAPSGPPKLIKRPRQDRGSKMVDTAARPKSKPRAAPKRTADIQRTATSQRTRAAGDTEPCRLKAFGGLLKALNSTDCEI